MDLGWGGREVLILPVLRTSSPALPASAALMSCWPGMPIELPCRVVRQWHHQSRPVPSTTVHAWVPKGPRIASPQSQGGWRRDTTCKRPITSSASLSPAVRTGMHQRQPREMDAAKHRSRFCAPQSPSQSKNGDVSSHPPLETEVGTLEDVIGPARLYTCRGGLWLVTSACQAVDHRSRRTANERCR